MIQVPLLFRRQNDIQLAHSHLRPVHEIINTISPIFPKYLNRDHKTMIIAPSECSSGIITIPCPGILAFSLVG